MRDYTNGKRTVDEETPQTKKKQPQGTVTRRVAVGIGAVAAASAAVFALSRMNVLPNPFEKKEPEPEPEPTPEPEPLPSKLDAGTYTVGTDIEPGLWSAYRFRTDADAYMSVTSAGTTYDLLAPKSTALRATWANQTVLVDLKDKDVVEVTGTIEKVNAQNAVRNLEQVPPLRSGLLRVGSDIAAGFWEFKPLDTIDYLDVEGFESDKSETKIPPYNVVDINQTWAGRLYGELALWAEGTDIKKQEDLLPYQGLIWLDEDDAAVIDSPFFLADIGFAKDSADPITDPEHPELDGAAITDSSTDAASATPSADAEPEPEKGNGKPTEDAAEKSNTSTSEEPKDETTSATESSDTEAPADQTTSDRVPTPRPTVEDATGFDFLLDCIRSPYAFVRINEAAQYELRENEMLLPLFITGKLIESTSTTPEEGVIEDTTETTNTEETDATTDETAA